MPVTPDNYKRAQSALDAAKADPNADPEKVQRLQMNLNSFYESYNGSNVDENGQRTAEPIGKTTPNTTAPQPLQSTPDAGHDFYYEPPAEKVRQYITQNPQLAEQLHIGSYIGSPDQVASIDEHSDAYKAVADEMYKQAAQNAQQAGKHLTRYSEVSFRKNPFDYLSGLAGRVGPTVFSGLNKTFGGLAEPAAKAVDSVLGTTPTPEQNAYDASRNTASEPASTAVEVGSMFLPFAPGNLAARGVLGAGKYAARGVGGKLALGALAGTVGANAQGITGDIGNAVNNGGDVNSVLKSAYENAPMRSLVGGSLGAAGDIVSQGANAVRGSIRNAPAYRDLNTLEQAGGGTKVLKGVIAPEAVNENIRQSNEPGNRGIKTAADIAAEKVAPQIHQSLKAEREAAVKEAEKNLAQYFQENKDVRHPTKEVVDEIISQLSKGHLEKPNGEIGHIDEKLAATLRKHFATFGSTEIVTPEKAKEILASAPDGGRRLFPKEIESISGYKFRGIPGDIHNRGVAIVRPHLMNPEQLHVAEQAIARELRYGVNGEPVDNPSLKAIQRALFQVRDKFTAPLGGEADSTNPWDTALQREDARLAAKAAKEDNGIISSIDPLSPATEPQSIASPKSSTQSLNAGNVEDITSERAGSETGLRSAIPTGADVGSLPPEATLKNDYSKRESSQPTQIPIKKNGEAFTPDELEKAATVADGKAFYDDLFAQGREARLRENRRLAQSVENEDKFTKGLANGQTENYEGAPPVREKTERVERVPAVKEEPKPAEVKAEAKKEVTEGKTQGADTAVLEDGRVVRGLSALQRKHHEALSALEEATKDTGGSNPKAIHRKVIGFKNGNDMFANQELSNQARKLGLENQLHEVAATNVFPTLKERQNFEGKNGILNATKDAALFRLIDPLAGYVGNAPSNPFAGNPYSPTARIQQYWLENAARNMLNMQGGLPGARFGNSIAEKIKEEQDKQAAEEAMLNTPR